MAGTPAARRGWGCVSRRKKKIIKSLMSKERELLRNNGDISIEIVNFLGSLTLIQQGIHGGAKV